MPESPILIDLWTVEAERQEELLDAISANVERLLVHRPGFVSADLFQSANRDMVLLKVTMRTAHDRQELTDSPELEAVYRDLRHLARSHTHIYRLARTFSPEP
ncbi:MAG TPA: hypothetical protein VNV44_13140 [Solirubrobacteraceae bacterium]|nr:hypothetical protein [Solirubrobacteraceae bacterium]